MDQMAAFRATRDRGDLGSALASSAGDPESIRGSRTLLSSEGFAGDRVAIGYIEEVRCGEALRQLPDETHVLPQENVNNLPTTFRQDRHVAGD
jgi:hypothetical protein